MAIVARSSWLLHITLQFVLKQGLVQQRKITLKFYTTHESIEIQGDMDVIDLVK